jgi:hypothetical protein
MKSKKGTEARKKKSPAVPSRVGAAAERRLDDDQHHDDARTAPDTRQSAASVDANSARDADSAARQADPATD